MPEVADHKALEKVVPKTTGGIFSPLILYLSVPPRLTGAIKYEQFAV